MSADRRFAKDVARELDRRRMRRRLLFTTAFVGLAVLAIMYVRCGGGWGFGGDGKGSGAGTAIVTQPVKKRCAVFIAKEGITVFDKKMTRDEAVKTCTKFGEADLEIAGDAKHGEATALEKALKDNKIDVYVRR